MKFIRRLHESLLAIPGWRTRQRRLDRRIKSIVGLPDAYGDILRIAECARADAILDIGSYVGDTIQRFIDESAIPVYGFEPTPETFDTLSARFRYNPQVRLANCALSDHIGIDRFFCNAGMQTNSLLDNDSGNIGSFPDHTRHVQSIEVAVTTLDSWLGMHLQEGWLVIKADMQGAEGMLLEGGNAAFSSRVIAFYSEAQLSPMYRGQVTFAALHERLTGEYGFALYNTYPCLRDRYGRAVQLDALWVKEDTLKGACSGAA